MVRVVRATRLPRSPWATFYGWNKRYAQLGVTELRELRQLREENCKLKHLAADLTLDRTIMRESGLSRGAAQISGTTHIQFSSDHHSRNSVQKLALACDGVE